MKALGKTRKVHVLFSVGLVIILLIGVIPRMAAGERLFQALWGGLTDVRPVEWVMFFAFWYTLAKNNLSEGGFTSPQTLGLADRNGG